MNKLLVIFFSLFISSMIQASTLNELNIQVKEKAELAIAQLQERAGRGLNYEPFSLAYVEEILAKASSFYDEIPQDQLDDLCQIMGAYILYVGYVEHGGKFYWNKTTNQPFLVVGEPEFSITLESFKKVKKRLSGDESEDIQLFYKRFSERVSNESKTH